MRKILFWIIVVSFLLVGEIQAEQSAYPLDLAFTRKTFPYGEQPVLSPDGRFVVFGIFTPQIKSPGSELDREPRYLPNGTPVQAIGSRLFITEIATKKTKPLLADKSNSWHATWSPDSRYVAFYSDAHGAPHLWVFDLEQEAAHKVCDTVIKAKLWYGDQAFWSPNATKVYVPVAPLQKIKTKPRGSDPHAQPEGPKVAVYRSGKEVEELPESEKPDPDQSFFIQENNAAIAAVTIKTGAVQRLVPADQSPRPSVLRMSPSGKWISYLSVFYRKDPSSFETYHDLAVFPSAGGSIQFQDTELEVSEMEYFGLTYRWHPTKDQVVFTKGKKLWMVDMTKNKPNALPLAADLGDICFFPLAFTQNGDAVIIGTNPVSDNDYSDPRPQALALVYLDKRDPKVISLDKNLIYKGILMADPRTVWQPEMNTITVMMEDPSTGEHALIRFDLKSGQDRVLMKDMARLSFYGSSSDQDLILATFENAHNPPNLFLFNHDFSQRTQLSDIEPRLSQVQVGPVKTFEIRVPYYDGSLVSAKSALFLPPGTKKGDPLPTLVFNYGGSRLSRYVDRFGGGSPSTIPVLMFTSRGYAVLLPDLRIGPEGQPGNPIQDMVDALLPQVYHAVDEGYVDINRVAIIGQSYGGYGAASIISSTNVFSAAVAISGLFDLPGLYSNMDDTDTSFNRGWSEQGQGRMGTHPWGDLMRYLNNSPYYRADKINTPFLILHGAHDYTCPVADAKKMFKALQRFDKTVQLAAYEGEGHTINGWSLIHAVDAYKRTLEFLEKYLPQK